MMAAATIMMAAAVMLGVQGCAAHAAPAETHRPGERVFVDSSLPAAAQEAVITGVSSWSALTDVRPLIILASHDEMARAVAGVHVPGGDVYVFGKDGAHGQCPGLGDINPQDPNPGYGGWVNLAFTAGETEEGEQGRLVSTVGAVMCLTIDVPEAAAHVQGGLAGMAAHEFGHALWLDHSTSVGARMFGDAAQAAPSVTCEDALALDALGVGYHAAASCR